MPDALGVGAKSLPRAIAVGNVETRCSRPLTLCKFGGCLDSKGDFRSKNGNRPNHLPVVRDVRAVLSRARGNIHLQKSYERTRPPRRPRTAGEQRSSRCFRTSMNTCGSCSAGQRKAALQAALARELAAVSRDGRHLELRKIGRIDVLRSEVGSCGKRRARERPFPAAHERCQRARLGGAAVS